MIKFW